MKRILGIIVVAAAVVAFKASASEHDDAFASPVATAAGSVGATGAEAVTGATQRARFAVGRFTGRIISPAISSMADKNAAEVEALQPAIRNATALRRSRALEINKRRVAADSLAVVMLHEGKPLAALRHAMKARSLVDAVRHQVTEELVR